MKKRLIFVLVIFTLLCYLTSCSFGKKEISSNDVESETNGSSDVLNKDEDKSWSLVAPMSTGRVNPGVAVYDNKIYIFGGSINRQEETNTVEVYDPGSDKWTLKANMLSASCYGAAPIGDLIYIIGKTVQIYDPKTDKWIERKHNVSITNNCGVAAANGKIYVIGGNDGNAFKVLEYNPESDIWTEKAKMKSSKRCYGIVSTGNLIYTVGGSNPEGNKEISDIEEYNPEKDIWTHLADMEIPRSDIAISVINRKIYITGGYQISGQTSLVEQYDMVSKQWETLKSMDECRGFHKAVALNGKLYVIGGTDLLAEPFNSIEVLDIK
ncbi:MAG: hypothetical protein N3I35_12300 [Clostridia bacterium]|nr:hypothetical protein [Clostridia bacterium]